MTDEEEIKEETKVGEVISETVGDETIEGEIKEAPPEEPASDQGAINKSEEFIPPPPEIPKTEEPCDPATMTCNEMRDQIIDLADKRSQLDTYTKSIDDTRKIIPSEHLDKAYDESVVEKQKVDDEIYGLFERFTVCTIKPEETKKEEPPAKPEETKEPE